MVINEKIYAVLYKNVCNEDCLVVFDNFKEARKLRDWLRNFDPKAKLLERKIYDKFFLEDKEESEND